MLRVVHIKKVYLPISETFVYSYLRHMTGIDSHVVAERLENARLFPFERKHVLSLEKGFLSEYSRLVHKITMSARTGLALLPRSPFAERICRLIRPDVIHAHGGYDAFRYASLKTRLGIPYVTTFYGRDAGAGSAHPYWRKAYSILFEIGDLFLVEGPAMRRKLLALGCPSAKIRVQRIGVDMGKFSLKEYGRKSDCENVVITMCGRMVEKKGFEYGIRAFSSVHSEFPRTEMRIIGAGPRFGLIKSLISSLGLDGSVRLLGYMSHQQYALVSRETDIFVQPSVRASDGDSEGGAPTTLLEMQAMGIPIVSTYHDDIPDVVSEGKSAFLVRERDPDALAERIRFLLANPQLWQRMGRKGREQVKERHDILRLARQLESAYAELAGLKG